jgi:HEAT repeat protein
MAFVKAAPAQPVPPQADDLASPDAAARRRAARALAGHADAAPALAMRLAAEQDASVREALFGSLVDTGGTAVAALIAPLVRSEDAALRNEALEALKELDEAADAAVDTLLADESSDVRLLAVEVTRAWTSERAAPRLQKIFEAETHVNVCGAAVEVATEVGTQALLPALASLRARFAAEPFLVFAVDTAATRIAGRDLSMDPPCPDAA